MGYNNFQLQRFTYVGTGDLASKCRWLVTFLCIDTSVTSRPRVTTTSNMNMRDGWNQSTISVQHQLCGCITDVDNVCIPRLRGGGGSHVIGCAPIPSPTPKTLRCTTKETH